MKPAADLNIRMANVAGVKGGDVLPLSTLAAHTEGERAENFEFTDQDRELLKEVLADGDERNAHQRP